MSRTCFFFRSPPVRSINMGLLLKPFQDMVWVCFGATLVVAAGALTISLMFEKRKKFYVHYNDALFLIACEVCQQGRLF